MGYSNYINNFRQIRNLFKPFCGWSNCAYTIKWLLAYLPLDKIAAVSQTTFSMNFLEWKCLNIGWNFLEVCCQVSNWQFTSIVSDNGMAPNRRQAIIWKKMWPKLPTHLCATPPQWVNDIGGSSSIISEQHISQCKLFVYSWVGLHAQQNIFCPNLPLHHYM